jgi:glycosyltransferase involved in cell wall biosynthesis
MKIAIVINKSWNIYNFRLGLIKAFQLHGYSIIAIAPEDEYSKLLKENGCEFYPLKMEEKGSNPLKDILLIFQLYKIYKSVSPDAILQYTIKPNIYGTIAAKMLGIPVVNNVSGLGTVFLHDNLTSRVAQGLYRFAFRFPSKVFFQNNDDLQLFLEKKLVKKKITGLLPGSGINLKKYTPVPHTRNSEFKFLVIARLLFDKGLVEFEEAARILKDKGIKARFQILGFTDFNSKLGIPKDLLDQWIKNGNIEYLGTTDNIIKFVNEVDCVVLPSYREGTPRTLLEAASLGKPLIATNVPGCKEVIIDNFNGYLCEVKNAEDLAQKMFHLYNLTENELINLGKNSRRLAEEKFDEEVVFEQYFKALNLGYKSINN